MSSHASRRIRIIAVVIGAAAAVGAGIAAPALAAPALPAAPVPAPIDGLGVVPDLDAPGLGDSNLVTPEGLPQVTDATGALSDTPEHLIKADNTSVTTAGDSLPGADAESVKDTGQGLGDTAQEVVEGTGMGPIDSQSLVGGLPAVPAVPGAAPVAPQD